MQQGDRLVSFTEVQAMTGGLSRTTIWRLVRAGRFPKSVSITERRKGWYLSEVLEWVRARGTSGSTAGGPGSTVTTLAARGQ
jgi:prophage regulatory protein